MTTKHIQSETPVLAIIYCRVSSAKQKIEGSGLQSQEHRCRMYAETHVTVRLRRVPLRRSSKLTSSIMQPSALLELSLSPVFPGYCDQEISELLLAEMLRRLLPAVDATSVEWLDTEIALTCEQFLGVFAPGNGQPEHTHLPVSATAEASANLYQQAGSAKPRGHAGASDGFRRAGSGWVRCPGPSGRGGRQRAERQGQGRNYRPAAAE